ncbi:ABC-type cobalamin/Fe3+-siderophores transport system ATPase component [uncultured Sporomusa sp.]|uniref:ABC-type cobalamin/Fe3+-siderophores transport system ATPase component n=1 Tax=uncultured Sporomusa sp. TaxID=307249 RepID=A0A212LYY5_9FIRM|nr:ABC transporter ATP-binding protein [uncultured Sporomusa sp.]SCM82716.1 ABC-type cobalamin/Fe3+-siderophores transport system ATPase component [uncultured Sporomusa sp.]
MIKVENVSFKYAAKQVLQDISFNIRPGSFNGIVGPNGSGKTTLLNIITGQLTAAAGRISLRGRDIGSYRIEELARHIAVVPQNMDIRFPYTCLEIVGMGRTPFKTRLQGLTGGDLAIIENAMRLTDTLDFAGRLVTELSGGERQRVLFAKALAQQPELLFLDESFSNMDIYYSIKCLNLLRELCVKQGLTVVSIIHDLNLVSAFCSDAVVLAGGSLITHGPAPAVLTPELIKEIFRIRVVRAGETGLAVLSDI